MFKSSKIRTAEELSVSANKVLSLFHSTISNLENIVQEASQSISEKESQIKVAQEEKAQLEVVKTQNITIIERIKTILK